MEFSRCRAATTAKQHLWHAASVTATDHPSTGELNVNEYVCVYAKMRVLVCVRVCVREVLILLTSSQNLVPGLSQGLRDEVAPFGIKVAVVQPGFTKVFFPQ